MEASQKWLDWFVSVNNIKYLWKAQPTYLISQGVFLLAGLLTFIHAFKKGGRWPWFWLATICHGLVTDNFWAFILPEFDNFWHSQTPVMFLGARLPLHIIFLYPAFIYHAAHAVSKLNLPFYAESFAVGLVTVLIDLPYDIVAVKFVHWTWHDTDPNIYDRHYWVPWNSYYFHATFACSLHFIFHMSRRFLAPKVEKWSSAGMKIEFKSFLLGSLLGMPGGVLLFIPLYHPLHDNLQIHTEVTFFALFSIYGAIVLSGLIGKREKSNTCLTKMDYVLIVQLALHYLIYWAFVVWFSPEAEWSLGFHEPIGPCDQNTSLTTPFGQKLYKRKYLCVTDYDEQYFDFHCAKEQKLLVGTSWYLICGTPFRNRAEYITILTSILTVAFGVFYSIYFKTPKEEVISKKIKTK